MNLSIFCSGNGSNLQAIINSIRHGRLKARIALVVSDQQKAFALQRARRAKLDTLIAHPRDFKSKADYERFLVHVLKKRKVSLVVLAGFMRILSPYFVRQFKSRIMNIHPSLLPAFKGAHAIQEALENGVKVTGVTVHMVTDELDAGPVIVQEPLVVKPGDTLGLLSKRIHSLEHKLYPLAIDLFVRGRLRLKGRKVLIGRHSPF